MKKSIQLRSVEERALFFKKNLNKLQLNQLSTEVNYQENELETEAITDEFENIDFEITDAVAVSEIEESNKNNDLLDDLMEISDTEIL
jgi:hypothetical protein